jgi:hypothetical protein
MNQEDGETSNSTPQIRQSASSSLNRQFPPPPPSHQRYPGDGLDFRRPIMSAMMPNSSSVIDLTDETEPAATRRSASTPRNRFSQPASWGRSTRAPSRIATDDPEVIDLDDDDGRQAQETGAGRGSRRESSPEVQFLYANQSNQGSDARRQWPSDLRAPPAPVELGAFTSNPPFSSFSRPSMAQLRHFLGGSFGLNLAALLPAPPLPGRTQSQHARRRRRAAREPLQPNLLSAGLDYEGLGFNYSAPSAPVPRPPTYEKPALPREGFTRAPQEDEAVVCPNCDHELGTGDDELKRQVWAIRSCGHVCLLPQLASPLINFQVYCGECTKFRTKRARQRGGDTSVQPFATCVVDDCKSRTTGQKAMFQIYI